MSTRSMVGLFNPNTGEVKASYVHMDGYLQGVGNTLLSYYNSTLSAVKVAHGGYLSSLLENYTRSRLSSVNNDWAPEVFESVADYIENAYDYSGAKYIYIWDGYAWFYAERSQDGFQELIQT
jgi:hypothetical protein